MLYPRNNISRCGKRRNRFRARVFITKGQRVHVGVFGTYKRALQAIKEYLKPKKRSIVKHVLLNGAVHLYQLKAPFSSSGKSILGALEYDKKTEKVKCHECGIFQTNLGQHIRHRHELTAGAYKLKHGMPLKSSLSNEATRKRAAACMKRLGSYKNLHTEKARSAQRQAVKNGRHTSKTAQSLNRNRLCPAQIIERIKNLSASLGSATPTHEQLQKAGISLKTVQYVHGSIAKAIELSGLGKNAPKSKYTSEQLLESLRVFYRLHGYSPTRSDFKRGLLPAYHCYTWRFGNLTRAWDSAGLPINKETIRGGNGMGKTVSRMKQHLQGGKLNSAVGRSFLKEGVL